MFSNFFPRLLLKIDSFNVIRISDKLFLKCMYRKVFHKKLNLKNPQTFNEKLQWLKLHDRKDIYTTMVDKYEAKKYVANIIGKEYIIPTLGIYDSFDEIDFSKLPNQFVIKCTHDSGGLVVVKDKDKIDIENVKNKISKCLKNNFYYSGREWPYKNVKPRILVERYLGNNINDYKIQCFNGHVDNIMICDGRFSKRGVRYYYFDCSWKYLPYCKYDDINPNTFLYPKPDKLNDLMYLSNILCRNLNQIRVDWYIIDNKIYFGELTFYTNSGFDTTITKEADIILGNKLILEGKNEN